MHISVLKNEVLSGLEIKPNDIVLDCTINGAGHSSEIARLLDESGTLVGLDADGDALKKAEGRLGEFKCKLFLRQTNFRNLDEILNSLEIPKIDKVLFDFGLSSNQLADSERGFSFDKDEPLIMTFKNNPDSNDLTADTLVNGSSEEALANIIYAYGEERYSRKIANAIVNARIVSPIKSTSALVEIVKSAVPSSYRHGKIHPATKTFQALRIAVNDELGSIRIGLAKSFERLNSGGRLVAISFHSLEDREVKNFSRAKKREGLAIEVTRKPITASREEILTNPRSRSAKLRIIIKK